MPVILFERGDVHQSDAVDGLRQLSEAVPGLFLVAYTAAAAAFALVVVPRRDVL